MAGKELFPEDIQALDAAAAAVADYAKTPPAERDSFGKFVTAHNLTEGEPYADRGYLPDSDAAAQKELGSLIGIGRSDAMMFYGGAYDYLGNQGFEPEDRLAVVQRSLPLAHSLGSRSSGQSHRLAAAAAGEPDLLFALDVNKDDLPVLTYTPEARLLYVSPVQSREYACPALRTTVMDPNTERPINVYDEYWKAFCEEAHTSLVGSQTDEATEGLSDAGLSADEEANNIEL